MHSLSLIVDRPAMQRLIDCEQQLQPEGVVLSFTEEPGCSACGVSAGSFLPEKLQALARDSILPACRWNDVEIFRQAISQQAPNIKLREFSLRINGLATAGLAITAPQADFAERPWILYAPPNAGVAHAVCLSEAFVAARVLKANVLCVNYPGVCSEDRPSPSSMIATYEAALRWLEMPKKDGGWGAKKIVPWGYSIGGAVLGEVFRRHVFKQDIQYVAVRQKSFSQLDSVAEDLTKLKLAAWGVRLIRWNLEGCEGSRRLEEEGIHELIVQNGGDEKRALDSADKIRPDGVISNTAALAYALLSEAPEGGWVNKTFIGDSMDHGALSELSFKLILTGLAVQLGELELLLQHSQQTKAASQPA